MIVTVRHITNFLERRAYPSLKLSYDNVGLQAGKFEAQVNRILTCLDLTEAVVDEAIQEGFNLIVAHHPLIFPNIKSVNDATAQGRLLLKLIQNDINFFVAHTNLDSVKEGVSFVLAEKLGLKSLTFLGSAESYLQQFEIRFSDEFLPEFERQTSELKEHFINRQQFSDGRQTYVHLLLKESDAKELNERFKKFSQIQMVQKTDTISNPEFGFGAVGELPIRQAMNADEFKSFVCERLGIHSFRFSGARNQIKKVAVMGGSGSSFLKEAIRKDADAYITADIKYHDYFVADSDLLFIDIGHYETEHFIADTLQHWLQSSFPELSVKRTRVNTNPMQIFVHQDFNHLSKQPIKRTKK